ncbi:MAG: hypothetical protein KAI53_01550 [Candidatus Aenigmarchaeota archaeon]|nr:hypothetical protein [Candidatus Aenigmarchaeota archaeon]
MEIDITNDRKNPLMERRDIQFFISHEGITPSKKELEKEIAEKLKAKETHVVVTHVYQGAGRWDVKGIAKVYDKAIKEAKKEEAPKAEESTSESKPEESKDAPKEKASDSKPVEEEKKEEPETKAEEPKEVKKENPAEKTAEDKPKEDTVKEKDSKEE